MEDSTQREELLDLLSQLTDAELDEVQTARLEEILAADPSARLLYMQHIDLQIELACMTGAAAAAEAELATPAVTTKDDGGGRSTRSSPQHFRWLAAAAALALGLGLLIWRGSADDKPIAFLQHISGDVMIVPGDGLPWSPDARVEVRSSYTIRLRGNDSSAVLIYPDKTLVALVGDTELSFGGGDHKDLKMRRGVIAASVAKQPAGRPMTVATPRAAIEVVGTEFTLEADEANTHLAVLEGAVDFIRSADTNRVQVTGGTVATVGSPPPPGEKAPELVAEPPSAPPPDWSIDFEGGMPAGWKRGDFETADLPIGSQGGARAERVVADGRVYHQIEPPSQFIRGMFQITDQTHLHLTYKLDKPDWVNIFIGARSPDLRGASWELYKNVAINAESSPAGEWQTITIPMKLFEPAGSESEGIIGKIPYAILISSTPHPRGLMVDAIWVTQGGPGEVQVKSVQNR